MKHIVVSEELPKAKALARFLPEIDTAEALSVRRAVAASGTRAAPFFSPMAVACWLSRGETAASIAQAGELEQLGFLGWYCLSQSKAELGWGRIQDIEETMAALAGAVVAPTSVGELPLTALMLAAGAISQDSPLGPEGARSLDALLEWYADDLLRWFCIHGLSRFGLTGLLTREQKLALRRPAGAAEGTKASPVAGWTRAMRPDVQDAFDIKTAHGVRQLEDWFLQYGLWEFGLSFLLLPEELDHIGRELATPEAADVPAALKLALASLGGGGTPAARAAALLRQDGFWRQLPGPRGAAAVTFPNRTAPGQPAGSPGVSRPLGGGRLDARTATSRYRIPAGRRVYFLEGSGAVSLLIGGWNQPGQTHTWSAKPFATIAFALDPEAPGAPGAPAHVEIELEIHCDPVANRQVGARLTLTLDGAVLDHADLQAIPLAGGYATMRAVVPYRAGVRVLGVCLDRVFSPSQFGGGDPRALGVAVRSLLVRWC